MELPQATINSVTADNTRVFFASADGSSGPIVSINKAVIIVCSYDR